MTKPRMFFSAMIALSFAVQVKAGGASLQERKEQLLQLERRPSIEQIEEILGADIKPRPFPAPEYNDVGGDLLESYANDFARVLAMMEKAFPGALFLGLGRDSALMVDAIDAFYSKQGQKNRAKLIEASGDSFSEGPSHETVVKFLENYGLNLDSIEDSRPIVIFDGTRFNHNSQSRMIMTSIYAVAEKKGLDLKKLVRKVNFVSTCFNGYQYYPRNLISQIDLESYFKTQEAGITRSGPEQILSVDAWYMTHGYNWTDTYGPFYKKGGRVLTKIGYPMSSHERSYVLGHQIHVRELVQTAGMKAQVFKQAKALGYDFNKNLLLYQDGAEKKDQNNGAVKAKVAKADLNAELKAELADLQKLPALQNHDYQKFEIMGEKMRLTENGNQFMTVIINPRTVEASNYHVMVTEALIEAYKTERIGARDFRRILVYALSLKPLNEKAKKKIQSYYQEILPIEILLGREDNREKYLDQKGTALDNYKLLINNGKLPMSCRFTYMD